MSVDFYVIGLPRSRTVWLSHLLTDDNTECLHEYYSSHETRQEPEFNGKRIGCVDTNPLSTPDYGDKPVVIVKRDPEEVKRALFKCFDKPDGVDNFEAFISSFVDKYKAALSSIKPKNAMYVEFDDLSNIDTLRKLCEFVGVEASDDRLVDMAFTRISTVNRDIETSLKNTAECEGLSYKDYLATFYAAPVVTCERIFNTVTAQAIFNTCWDEVSADGVAGYTPDVIGENWVGLIADGQYVGVYRFHQTATHTWEGHAHMIPDKRKAYTKASASPIKRWMLENLEGLEKINVTIPALYQNVVRFTESIGFIREGVDRMSFMKNGELHDQVKLGMTRAEIEGSL